ncbi:unnamed protein product [Ectocarpus sp. CCAP 1310/34]|nr:unnamed protein product [Ectocarpus sp. CCAP 1310/34]CAB1099675.1 unnamed protein product [Ectocarpus sp. CCAP 1310/34]
MTGTQYKRAVNETVYVARDTEDLVYRVVDRVVYIAVDNREGLGRFALLVNEGTRERIPGEGGRRRLGQAQEPPGVETRCDEGLSLDTNLRRANRSGGGTDPESNMKTSELMSIKVRVDTLRDVSLAVFTKILIQSTLGANF